MPWRHKALRKLAARAYQPKRGPKLAACPERSNRGGQCVKPLGHGGMHRTTSTTWY